LNVSPDEVDAPVLMIGPGTGVAPMRSMAYERVQWAKKNNSKQSSVLFFGCRNEKADYFFADEWQDLAVQGLTVFPGFSRDKDKPKTYVQDLIRQKASLVYQILERDGGKVYVCGSSGNMPKGVREALSDVLREHGQMEMEKANEYLDQMEKDGRYKQETW